MIVGCYDLHLYCDAPGCELGRDGFQNTYEATAETGGACRRRARRAGWRLDQSTGECICPGCAKNEIQLLVAKLGSMEKAAKAMGTTRSSLYRILGGAGGYRVHRK